MKRRAYEPHPAAVFPELTEPELAALALDVRRHGLVNPIVLCDGKVLDGRGRLRACERAGVEPKFFTYEGDDPVAFVAQANAGRQLTMAQRAIAAARLARALKAEPSTPAHSGDLTDRAARALGVSRRTVFNAEKLLGDGALLARVERGELRVREALRELAPEPRSTTSTKKKYWREPLADKLSADLQDLVERLRNACADELVRSMLAKQIESAVTDLYAITDGSSYASEGSAA